MSDTKCLKLRCLLERDGDLYLAYCIDLSLGVQGDSADEVRDKLHAQIVDHLSYVEQLYREGDVQGARQLLHRKAPLSTRIRYHWAGFVMWLRGKGSDGQNGSSQQPAQDRPRWNEIEHLACP